jgi:hypothetical protein
MKYAWIIALLLTFAAGCDIIDNPRKEIDIPTTGPDSTDQKVLIEDFTGHLCKNCPKATKAAKEIEAAFPGYVHTLAIYSKVGNSFNNINADYPTDFTNADSDDLFSFYNVLFSMPFGMVNRTDWAISPPSHLKSYPGWAQASAPFIGQKTPLQIVVVPNYNASNRTVNVTVRTHAIQEVPGPLKITGFILENGVVSPQLLPDDTRDPVYVHNHILRAAMNSPFGEQLTNANYPAGQSIAKNLTQALDANWVAENCDVLVLVYNENTHLIIQSEVVSLIP